METIREVPEILYKYKPWKNEFAQNILFKNEIFLPSPTKFNDPYEGATPFEYEAGELTPENIFLKMRSMALLEHPDWDENRIHAYVYAYQQKNLLFDDAHKEKQYKRFKKKIETKYGILSLTTKRNNFLMWSHYADSHSGFCVGFDSKLLFNSIKGGLAPVNYQKTIPRFKLFEDITEFSQKLLGTKSDIWEYEDEYRLIKQGASNKVFIVPKDCLRELILGVKMNFKTKNLIIEHVRNNLPNCIIYETKLNMANFQIDLMQIY